MSLATSCGCASTVGTQRCTPSSSIASIAWLFSRNSAISSSRLRSLYAARRFGVSSARSSGESIMYFSGSDGSGSPRISSCVFTGVSPLMIDVCTYSLSATSKIICWCTPGGYVFAIVP